MIDDPSKPNAKKLVGKTFQQLADQAEHLSYGLISLNLVSDPIDFNGKQLKTIGIVCNSVQNIEERLIQIAALYQQLTTVYVDSSWTVEEKVHVLTTARVKSICAYFGTEVATVAKTITDLKTKVASIQTVVVLDQISLAAEVSSKLEEAGLKIISLEEVINNGRHQVIEIKESSPDDCFSIVST